MKEVLQQLANLQYIDSRIDELKQLRGDLPEDIMDVETDIARLEAKQAKLEQEDKDLSVELNQLELDITSSTEKAAKYEEQQLSVRNNREYDALTKQIEVQKQVVEKAHVRIEHAAKRKEMVAPEKAEIDAQLEEIQAKLAEMKTNLDSVMSSTQEEETMLLEKRDEVVKNIDFNSVEITSQNHGFAVDYDTAVANKSVKISHKHLNDQTVAGLEIKSKNCFSVQYHPEASPGPHDSNYLFDQFIELIKSNINE